MIRTIQSNSTSCPKHLLMVFTKFSGARYKMVLNSIKSKSRGEDRGRSGHKLQINKMADHKSQTLNSFVCVEA